MFDLFDDLLGNLTPQYLEGSDSKISEHERDQLQEPFPEDMDPVKRAALEEVRDTGNRKGPMWKKYCGVNYPHQTTNG